MVAMVIDAAERFKCRHELVGLPGFFRCAKCPFQVAELPLSRATGATILSAMAYLRRGIVAAAAGDGSDLRYAWMSATSWSDTTLSV
jgi:hypothetical protein